ncbi:5'-methylthioadenosine/adenosylhomocysteine nucleosidase [Clostridium sp. AM58-1XD]|uniref:5'-methylthioadenosine/adenosylhomocysteine nucleosidase n=1 Tax=Clostridium sp. AM58-1XD TaxID=2292307 RepID=UPI000E51605B|nr:5'-methylthioadenosine/adenosylhomocysteine nucleosidase [Clostridium sp. AM58-1XD]RGY94826.1 5'-methylthioadenosine/adenosylhomocysteine nucleosidase [Clostridium sp. AM58-1XD]
MLGIIGAMEEEVAKIKEAMEQVTIENTAGMEFNCGKLKGIDAVVVRSGIGKVNAALCSQILADRYHVNGIINTGIAGSLKNEINIGDIVLSSDALQHDMDATGFGYAPGQVPRLDVLSFPADESLIRLAKECCETVNPDIHVFTGRVVSGDQFISDRDKKDWLTRTFDGFCTEMEGAAIAQAAYLNNIPYLVIRAISDKADDSASVDYPVFEAKAIEHSVKLLLAMAERIDL